MFTNFEYITLFSCLNERNIFYKKFISIKQIIEKVGCLKSVLSSTVIYIIYITRTDFEHHFSHSFEVRVVLSRWTLNNKKSFVCWNKKFFYILKMVSNLFKYEQNDRHLNMICLPLVISRIDCWVEGWTVLQKLVIILPISRV